MRRDSRSWHTNIVQNFPKNIEREAANPTTRCAKGPREPGTRGALSSPGCARAQRDLHWPTGDLSLSEYGSGRGRPAHVGKITFRSSNRRCALVNAPAVQNPRGVSKADFFALGRRVDFVPNILGRECLVHLRPKLRCILDLIPNRIVNRLGLPAGAAGSFISPL